MNNNLENRINHRIAIVAGLLKRQVYRIITENNVKITPEQWVILNYLWKDDGSTIGELAKKSKKDFANVTRIVEKLQKLEYVIKNKNEKDSRSYRVQLTEKGRNIKPDIENCQNRSLNISLKDITKEEQECFLRILNKIEANIIAYLNK